MEGQNAEVSSEPPVKVLRHRAAIRRTEPSLPIKCLVRDNLLNSLTTFFDFGCGYGDDLEHVVRLGFESDGWDPAYRPDAEHREAHVVNLGYVINVIEDIEERDETLRTAWRLTRTVLAVAARIAVDGSGEGDLEFGDGVITRIQTFQKYFTQTELRLYIEKTLGTEVVPAAPGVFYVFKDNGLRESFAASKYRRRAVAPRRRVSEIQFDRHRDVLERLIKVASELGRLPYEDEFDGASEVIAVFGSMKQAYKLIRKVTGADPWDALRQSRIDDLRVYLALARFPKRPSFLQMPISIQRDIKEFFGSYKNACEAADALLFEAGDSELIDSACLRSKVGRLTSNALYLHHSAIPSLEPILRVFESCARAYLGEIDDANIVKLHRFSGKVSYLACPKFETSPHPPIRRTIKLSLRNLYLQCIDHAQDKNPLLLDQKEQMLEEDHPWRERFARFSNQESQHGLLDDLVDILSLLQWHQKLQDAGLMIRGYRLLYQEGVKRKRLPPKKSPHVTAATPEIRLPNPEDAENVDPHDLPAITAIDSDFEDSTESPTTRTTELPTRSRRFGVGKEIGYAVYVHRNYEDFLGATLEWAKRHLPVDYDYSVVKLNQRNDSVSFIHCPRFDAEHEPAIAAIIVVSADGRVQRRTTPSDPYIYHHKWLFVDDDYAGFSVEESKSRSQLWISLGDVDRSRIGRKSYWEEQIVPRLNQLVAGKTIHDVSHSENAAGCQLGTPAQTIDSQSDERWVRSAEVRKVLKLSTCELAHLRDAGKIDSKKVGNAYLYRLPSEGK